MSLVRVINRILLLAAISSPKIPQKSKKIIKRQTEPQLKKKRLLAEVVPILPPPPPQWLTKKERRIFRLNRTTWSQSSMEKECKFLQRSWMRIMIMINKN